jgi:glycosyltransferase involved in cell wall biosynthesis
MLIGLDARTIYSPCRRGTGKNLIDLYHHLAQVRPTWRVIAFHRADDATVDSLQGMLPGTIEPRRIDMPGDRFDAWPRLRLPMAAWRDRVDVLHSPANYCPPWLPVPTVVTIHDLIPLDMPQGRSRDELQRFHASVRRACRKAARIICPSAYTRDRLVDDFAADERLITVNPWAPDTSVQRVPREHWPIVLEQYGITRPFVLHFGAAEPRKNTERLIEAWAMMPRMFRQAFQLLVVGLDNAFGRRMDAMVRRMRLQETVRLYDFVPESRLPTLLSAADLLAYPSLSEGFGLPILDAWAAGTAVLTSHATSLPAVAADAAIIVDPTDPCAITRGLTRLLRDPSYRQELVERGRRRLRRFTWRATAERFARAMERAAVPATAQPEGLEMSASAAT